MEINMKSKNILVSFLAIASVLFLVATVSASDFSVELVEVNDVDVTNDISVIAGETIKLEVYFDSFVNTSDVKVKAEIEGEKTDIDARTVSFDTESGKRYRKVLTLKVPSELKDELSDDLSLNIKIWNGDYKETEDYTLRVQRESYSADVKSISTTQTVEAGELFPVDVVLKNVGYNDLDDVYVTASIPALGVERKSYFGGLVALECDEDVDSTEENYGVEIDRKCNEDDVDTVSGRLYMKLPFSADAGIYTLEVEVTNDDTTMSEVRQVVVENDFTGNVITTSHRKTVASGENAEYNILIVNPTNKLKVYRIVSESSADLSTSASDSVVAVPAGTSKTVKITANAVSEGEYNFDVNVFSGETLVDAVTLSTNVEGKTATNPIVVLTVILAIIFIVLLIVLIVLMGKKPEKAEEFGESYY